MATVWNGKYSRCFFRELGLALNATLRSALKKWSVYAPTLTAAGTATEWLGKALPFGGVPGGPIMESFGTGMKSAGASAKEGSEELKTKSEAAGKSLEDQKRELATLLGRLPQPLLVVINDIDRLTADEILQVFQPVKPRVFSEFGIAREQEKSFIIGKSAGEGRSINLNLEVGMENPRMDTDGTEM